MSWQTGTATDHVDLLNQIMTFLTTNGNAYGAAFSGTGNGTISAWNGGTASVLETFTITATSATTFSVVGSTSGNVGTATVGTQFTSNKLTFMLTAGSTAFVAGDYFKINTCPPYTLIKHMGGCKYYNNGMSTEAYRKDVYTDNSNCQKTALPTSLGMKMIQPTTVRSFGIGINNNIACGPTAITLQYSDDGTTWSNQQVYTGITWASNYQYQKWNVTTPSSHAHWRVRFDAGGTGSTVDCNQLKFFTDTDQLPRNQIPWEAESVVSFTGNDGTSSIVSAIKLWWSEGGDYYDFRMNAVPNWQPDTEYNNQAGGLNITTLRNMYQPLVTLWNKPMTYWVCANGQRWWFAARVSTVYVTGHIGFITQFITPGQWPWPCLVGGNILGAETTPDEDDTWWRWSNQDSSGHVSCWPEPQLNDYNDPNRSSGRLRGPDGIWLGIQRNDPGNDVGWNSVNCWPKGNYGNGWVNIRENLDGSYPLIPFILSQDKGNKSTLMFGEYDGVAAVPGYNNAAENLVTDGFFNWLVLQNVYRSGRGDYFAMKLD